VFSISQFGIYNSDCPHPQPQANSIQPVFVLKDKGNLVIPERVYLIDYSSKTVMGYNGMNRALSIPIDDTKTYGFCIFRNGQAFFCDQKQFQSAENANSREFIVNALPANLDEPSDFKKFLEL
jgi:hypothetical protein